MTTERLAENVAEQDAQTPAEHAAQQPGQREQVAPWVVTLLVRPAIDELTHTDTTPRRPKLARRLAARVSLAASRTWHYVTAAALSVPVAGALGLASTAVGWLWSSHVAIPDPQVYGDPVFASTDIRPAVLIAVVLCVAASLPLVPRKGTITCYVLAGSFVGWTMRPFGGVWHLSGNAWAFIILGVWLTQGFLIAGAVAIRERCDRRARSRHRTGHAPSPGDHHEH